MRAPRVHIEEGSQFKGEVDMDSNGEEKQPTLKEAPLALDRNVPTKS